MRDSRWEQPVEIGVDGNRSVTGPFEALIYLEDRWPYKTGAAYIRAKIACKAAIDGRLTAEEAREEFLAAADEARVTMH